MTTYQAESFYRAKITSSITASATCPITVRVSKLPTLSNALLTISPNTESEEIVEYSNPNSTNMTIDIIKRGIKPSSVLLTTAGVDYNNATYQKDHTQNDIIRGDVNHIHINQGIGNTTLATASSVGIVKLSVAPVDANNPKVVGDNDPRIVTPSDVTLTMSDVTNNNVSTVRHGFAPKLPGVANVFLNGVGGYTTPTAAAIQYHGGMTTLAGATTTFSRNVGFQPKFVQLEFSETFAFGQFGSGYIDNNGLSQSTYQSYATTSSGNSSQPIYLRFSDGSFADASVTLTATGFDITFATTRSKDIRLRHIAIS